MIESTGSSLSTSSWAIALLVTASALPAAAAENRVHRDSWPASVAAASRPQSHLAQLESAAHAIEIRPGSLTDALETLARQTGVDVIYPSSQIKGLKTAGLTGKLETQEAFRKLLEGTALIIKRQGDSILVSLPKSSALNGEDSGLRLARVGADTPPGNPGAEQAAEGSESNRLEEIVVTATKRAESVQDVPLSIATVTAQDIDRRGLVSADDYLRGIPGVSYTSAALDGSSIIIRGMETSPTAQNFSSGTTVATYFGETPTTNSGGLSGGSNIDIKLVDIERVEVLRGPQGTAFGNSSLGGAVRTIPVAPNLEDFAGKVGAGYSVTGGNGSGNHQLQGVANLPLIDGKLAVRGVGYQFIESGFYRNVAGSDPDFRAAAAAYGAEEFAVDADIGESNFTGGRIAALFQATDALTFTLSYLTQKTELDGVPLANSGRYEQRMLQVAPQHERRGQRNGLSDTDLDIANLVMEYNLGWGNLVATYSHVEGGSDYVVPFSYLPVSFAEPTSIAGSSTHREHSGEVRLVTNLEGAWNFIGGLYAEQLDDQGNFNYYWYGDPAANIYVPGAVHLGDYIDTRDLRQRAAFAEVSWKFLERFTLTGGARAYQYDRAIKVDQVGALFGDEHLVNKADASGTTFRGNLSYKLHDDALLYGTWSEGFRLGKPQPGLPRGLCDLNDDGLVDGTNTPLTATRSTKSDTVQNMEIGGKFTLFDRRLIINGDVYRIDWNDMPFRVITPPPCDLAYNANAGSARSEGVELQANIYVSEAVRVDAGGAWTHARLTADAPGIGALDDDRLPGSPRVSANLGLQYQLLLGRHQAFLRGDATYVGAFNSDIARADENEAGNYVQIDASARLAFDALSIDLFARNLTNVDDFVNRISPGTGFTGYRMRPRTVGLQLTYNF